MFGNQPSPLHWKYHKDRETLKAEHLQNVEVEGRAERVGKKKSKLWRSVWVSVQWEREHTGPNGRSGGNSMNSCFKLIHFSRRKDRQIHFLISSGRRNRRKNPELKTANQLWGNPKEFLQRRRRKPAGYSSKQREQELTKRSLKWEFLWTMRQRVLHQPVETFTGRKIFN